MPTFISNISKRSVKAPDHPTAATIFAERLGRREYGRRAGCVSLRRDGADDDGLRTYWDATVGLPSSSKRWFGRFVHFVVKIKNSE